MKRKEIRALARQELGRNLFGTRWLSAVLIVVVFLLIQSVCQIAGTNVSVRVVNGWYHAIASTTLVGSLVTLFVVGPLSVGLCYVFLETGRSWQKADIADLFHGASSGNFLHNIFVRFMKNLFLILWLYLFIIPGFVKYYSYIMTEFVAADNPNLSAVECITESRTLMDGSKLDFFIFQLSFLIWDILILLLSILASMFLPLIVAGYIFFVGFLWVYAYYMQSKSVYYRVLIGEVNRFTQTDDTHEYEYQNEYEYEYEFEH